MTNKEFVMLMLACVLIALVLGAVGCLAGAAIEAIATSTGPCPWLP